MLIIKSNQTLLIKNIKVIVTNAQKSFDLYILDKKTTIHAFLLALLFPIQTIATTPITSAMQSQTVKGYKKN